METRASTVRRASGPQRLQGSCKILAKLPHHSMSQHISRLGTSNYITIVRAVATLAPSAWLLFKHRPTQRQLSPQSMVKTSSCAKGWPLRTLHSCSPQQSACQGLAALSWISKDLLQYISSPDTAVAFCILHTATTSSVNLAKHFCSSDVNNQHSTTLLSG